jgi:type I restriction enzyme S subunit
MMSEDYTLPPSWLSLRLGDVINYGETQKIEPTQIQLNDWILELEDIEKDSSKLLQRLTFAQRGSKSTKTRFVKGDILYGKLRPYLNKVLIADQDGYCTTEIIPLKPNLAVNGRYLFYWLKHPTFSKYANSVSHGLNMPRLGTEAGLNAPFILAPLNEQKRIADKLDTLLARVDACRDHLERVPGILKRFRQAVLSAATSGRLTEEWRGQNIGSEEPQIITLRETGASFSYGSSAKSKPSGDIPVLRMGNIQNGKLDWSDLVYTSDVKEIAKYNLRPGDVLFNRTNSPELVGKTAVYKGEMPAIYAGYLIRVQCGNGLLPDYLNYCLNSPAGRDWSWQVKSDGVSQSNINAQKLAAFQFLLPSTQEQHEIVRRVEALFVYADRLETRYQAAHTMVDHLTPTLLAKAFRGELVAQDPDDEPASALLERIRAERETITSLS